MEVITIHIALGQPKPGCVKVYDALDQELTNIESVRFLLDESSGAYEINFMCCGQKRSATIINIELDNGDVYSAG